MRFDGRQPCLEIQVIDKTLEVLGPNGEHWTWGARSDRHGNRCILGAVTYAQRKLGIKRDKTLQLIRSAIYPPDDMSPDDDIIMDFNDATERSFDEETFVLNRARELAEQNHD
jgi:hypothetical protein